jgi:hypothetical protein
MVAVEKLRADGPGNPVQRCPRQFRSLRTKRFDASSLIRLGIQIGNHNIVTRGEAYIVAATSVEPLGGVEILRVRLPPFCNRGFLAQIFLLLVIH